MLKISVITATYNESRNLPRLIASLRDQTCRDFEWIVVDGGSTDGTLDILERVQDIDLLVDSRPDFGIYDALNRGVNLCSGEYYLVLGADDILYGDAIRNYINITNIGRYDLICGAVMFDNILRSGINVKKRWLGAAHMVSAHSVGMLIKKSLHQKVGLYSNKYPQCADGYFIKKIFDLKDFKYYELEKIVGRFSTSGVSNTNTLRGLCEGFMIQVETEKQFLIQMFLFLLRLLKNYKRIVNEISRI